MPLWNDQIPIYRPGQLEPDFQPAAERSNLNLKSVVRYLNFPAPVPLSLKYSLTELCKAACRVRCYTLLVKKLVRLIWLIVWTMEGRMDEFWQKMKNRGCRCNKRRIINHSFVTQDQILPYWNHLLSSQLQGDQGLALDGTWLTGFAFFILKCKINSFIFPSFFQLRELIKLPL